MNNIIVEVDVVEAKPVSSRLRNGDNVRIKLVGVGQPGIVLHDILMCTPTANHRIEQILTAVDHRTAVVYTPADIANAIQGRRARVEVETRVWKHVPRLSVTRWLPLLPPEGAETKRRRYRGQCELGHVFVGDLFAPLTPREVQVPCPLDPVMQCGSMQWHAYEEVDDWVDGDLARALHRTFTLHNGRPSIPDLVDAVRAAGWRPPKKRRTPTANRGPR